MMQKTITFFLYVTIVFILGISILSYLGKFHLLFDLLSSFKHYYFLCSIVFLIVAMILKNKKIIFLCAFSIILNGIDVLKCIPNYTIKKEQSDLKIFHANVLTSNRNKSKIFEIIKKENPDIIGLQEVDSRWKNAIEKKLSSIYKYQLIIPRSDNFGIALLSKIPFQQIKEYHFENKKLPAIIADIQVENKIIHLVYTHTLPPVSSSFFENRNQHIERIGEYVNSKNNCILFGDFNVTPWSTFFKKMEKESQLIHSTNRVFKTWPSTMAFIGIPIDHFLHSKELELNQVKVLKKFGSDHYPVIVEYSLP